MVRSRKRIFGKCARVLDQITTPISCDGAIGHTALHQRFSCERDCVDILENVVPVTHLQFGAATLKALAAGSPADV